MNAKQRKRLQEQRERESFARFARLEDEREQLRGVPVLMQGIEGGRRKGKSLRKTPRDTTRVYLVSTFDEHGVCIAAERRMFDHRTRDLQPRTVPEPTWVQPRSARPVAKRYEPTGKVLREAKDDWTPSLVRPGSDTAEPSTTDADIRARRRAILARAKRKA